MEVVFYVNIWVLCYELQADFLTEIQVLKLMENSLK